MPQIELSPPRTLLKPVEESIFSDLKIQLKDYGIGSNGKPETYFTLTLKQQLNPLAPQQTKELQLKLSWREVKK